MIPGLNSASVSGAIRTSAKARQTMDTMARQIATGQRVSSVKDDGAAWARAAGLGSQSAGNLALRTNLGYLSGVFEANRAGAEAKLVDILNRRETALHASDPGLSAAARAQIQVLHTEHAGGPSASIAAVSHGQRGDTGAAFTFNNLDAVNILTVVTGEDGSGKTYAGGSGGIVIPAGNGDDLSTAANAALSVQIQDANAASHRWRLQYWSSVGNALDRFDDYLAKRSDKLQSAKSALTDADMGKASTARANAETRQQLAMQTVRSAITAYGNMASGLLGNVARTQRGILA
jgi:flagellin-like hook-associated protein FlgL